MFFASKKLESNLQISITNKQYKSYRIILKYKTLRESIEKKIKGYHCTVIRSIPFINCISAILTASAIERLTELPEVEYICPDYTIHICGNSVLGANGIYHLERYKLTGNNIGIGLIDTGTYPHTDLLQPSNKIKVFKDLINNYNYPYDDNGHGSFLSGIICGSGASSKGNYKGVAENSHLYSIKAFNNLGRGFVSDILYAMDLILEEASKYNIRLICIPGELIEHNNFILSLFSKAFDNALVKGITVIVPSGHNGNTESSIKGFAVLNNCITVGGADTSYGIKPFKNSSGGPYGKYEKPDLISAAVSICSLNANTLFIPEKEGKRLYPQTLEKPYTLYTGTSCSAAFITGICALLLENKSDLNFKNLLSLLKVSCKLQDFSKHLQGAGIIDMDKLLP